MINSPYRPIDCLYYDRLEAWATLRQLVTIVWLDDAGVRRQINSKILNLILDDEVEYLIAEGDMRIRLDHLIAINDIYLNIDQDRL